MRHSLIYIAILLLSGYGSYCQTQEEEEVEELVFVSEIDPDNVVVVEGDTIIYTPEKAPSFPGGDPSIREHFRKHSLRYSRTNSNKNDKLIWVSFVIRSSGAIGKVNVIGSDKPKVSEKLTKAIKAMPAWIPAENNGKKVATIGDFYLSLE